MNALFSPQKQGQKRVHPFSNVSAIERTTYAGNDGKILIKLKKNKEVTYKVDILKMVEEWRL